jgi:hypothetical protein
MMCVPQDSKWNVSNLTNSPPSVISIGNWPLAAIEHLIRNGGRMRLLVGCTLDRDEVAAIEQGYDLR